MVYWHRWWGRTVMLALSVALAGGLVGPSPAGASAVAADLSVTIDPAQPAGVSHYATGLTHIDASLFDAHPAAMVAARAVVAQSAAFQNSHLMAWGLADPWPDPHQPGPTNWASLDSRMALAVASGATPIITLAQAPWWMKGQRQADGSTALLPSVDADFRVTTYAEGLTDHRGVTYPAGYTSPSPYAARILDNHMDDWLVLVEAAARRYMAPPYNVRYFQVWNELKGYHNPLTNQWDYDNSPGDPSGANAQHGYTYMYNQVYARLKLVAVSLGIPERDIQIGGPYVAFKTWSRSAAGGFPTTEPALQNKPYGTYDQRDADAIKYWLQHKVGAEFIVWDGGTKNRGDVNLVDPYLSAERFADTVAWLRGLDPALYPGADTLPVAYAEWYAFPYDTADPQQHASVKAYAALRYIQARGWLTLLWGGQERADPKVNASLYTSTAHPDGGQALPWAAAYAALKTHFSAGTVLVRTTQTSPAIGVLASAAKTLLVNKTDAALSVAVNGITLTLAPYAVVLFDTPPLPGSATATPTPTASPTASPTPTATATASPTLAPTGTPSATPSASPPPSASPTPTPDPAKGPPVRYRHAPRPDSASTPPAVA